ncbi:hypothetical protein KL86DYS1_10908 [uncultured Dysgonomonas sp.]|uniref:Uncharacterized protein n=1 Tax=uncultured Dysgonomonas sp. TaxID=206096 RepID=A0A212J2K2_9BACT|nr:hypothetical protein KL86DYS1_10908 [uncultured Dysgonomonas sp.]
MLLKAVADVVQVVDAEMAKKTLADAVAMMRKKWPAVAVQAVVAVDTKIRF